MEPEVIVNDGTLVADVAIITADGVVTATRAEALQIAIDILRKLGHKEGD